MRKERFATCVWGGVIGMVTGFSSVACMLTAFNLYAAAPVGLAVYCVITAMLCSLCSKGKWTLVPLGLGAVLLGYLWQSGILADSVESLLYRLTRFYHVAYKWDVVNWSGRTAEEMEETLAPILYALGCLITASATWAVCRRKTCIPAVLLAVLPLGTTMLVTDRVPAELWLFCLLLGLGMLLITGSVRRTDEKQGNRLTAILALPLLLALGLLFGLSPRQEYRGQETAEKLADTMFSTIQNQFRIMTGQNGVTSISADGDKVNLASVGVRGVSKNEALRVTPTDHTGTIYLRGRSLDYYDGVSWTNSGQGADLYWPDQNQLTYAGEMEISTRYAHRMLYLPYYTTSLNLEGVETGIVNDKELTHYSVACSVVPAGQSLKGIYDPTLAGITTCTQLPKEVEDWAVELAAEIVGDLEDPYEKAQAIAAYVRNSAEYDLETDRMPGGRTDFAKWFLEASDTGYCVHFATATAVLLKAAGIPARYVTGYAARVTQGQTTIVRSKDAHAWAEYWLPGFGWVVLEATPADIAASDNTDDPIVPPVDDDDDTQDPDDDDTQDPDDDDTQDPDPVDPVDPDDRPQDQDQQQGVSNTGGADGPARVQSQDLSWLLWLAAGLLALAAIPLQWRLRVRRRNRYLSAGTVNQRLLARWQYLCLLWKLTKQQEDQALFEVAQKAKFGPDLLETAQLLPFDKAIRTQLAKLRSRNVFLRLWYTLVLAVY